MYNLPFTVVLMSADRKSQSADIRQRQGARIKQHRELIRRVTQAQLAAELGVSKMSVSQWERGESSPRPHLQVALAKALNTPWSSLFGLDGEAA